MPEKYCRFIGLTRRLNHDKPKYTHVTLDVTVFVVTITAGNLADMYVSN
jgi:hypothetical protein